MPLVIPELDPSLRDQKKELDFDRREFDMLKRETELALKRRESDLEQRHRDVEFQHKQWDADLKERERAFESKQRDFQQEQRECSFQQVQRESRIEVQLKALEVEKKSLAVQQHDFEVKKRAFEQVEDQHRGLDAQKRDLDDQKRDLDVQKRDLDAQKRDLDAQKRGLDVQKHELHIQKHELETQKQIFELHKKDHQTQILEQHYFAPFLGADHSLVSSDNISTLDDTSLNPFVLGGSGSGSGSESRCGRSKDKLCSKQSGEQLPSVENHLDSKLSEIQLGKRQLKLLSEAVVRGFDDLKLQKDQFTKAQEAAKDDLEAAEDELGKMRGELKTAKDDVEKMRMAIEQDAKGSIAKAKRESQESLTKPQNESKQLLRGLNNLLGCKLVVGQVKGWHSISNLELARVLKIIQDCNKNSKHYGASADAKVCIEYCCEQLAKQTHINTEHYLDLLRFIFDTGDRDHINPHDPKVTYNSFTIMSHFWKSDTDSGEAPKLTPNLKVFFSSPNINNGDWIQFHGPGTLLYQVDPGFKLTLGSLCDPDRKGSFKSVDHTDSAADPEGLWNGKPGASDYQIKFKWA